MADLDKIMALPAIKAMSDNQPNPEFPEFYMDADEDEETGELTFRSQFPTKFGWLRVAQFRSDKGIEQRLILHRQDGEDWWVCVEIPSYPNGDLPNSYHSTDVYGDSIYDPRVSHMLLDSSSNLSRQQGIFEQYEERLVAGEWISEMQAWVVVA